VGDFLGSKDNEAVLEAYFASMDFKGKSVMEAMREFFSKIEMPEAAKTERLIEGFCKAYEKQNTEGQFTHLHAIETIVSAIMLLHRDLHSDQVKKKMPLERFQYLLAGQNKER